MNNAPLTLPPVDPGMAAMQDQLFRYAKDLQELMEQQRQLQLNYQTVLKSMGHEVPANDLLASTLIDATAIHVVTDSVGVIIRVSAQVNDAFGLTGLPLTGVHIDELLAASGGNGFRAVIAKLARSGGPGGIEQRRLELGPTHPGASPGLFDLLAMQVAKESDRTEIYWLFQPAVQSTAIAIQSSFINACLAGVGFFVTDPSGTICSVNEELSKLTGFSSADMLGQNPRLLGSGRHENAFFQDFFLALLGAGSWNGQILNRKKNGQILLSWQSVKMVEDENGQITSYIAAVSDLSLTDSHATLTSPAAYRNPVTGLANSRALDSLFAHALNQARTEGNPVWTLFLNVDGLGCIGDELGYAAIDLARREIGLRLRSIERQNLDVADVGEGNFVILLQGALTESDVSAFAISTSTMLSAPLHIEQQWVTITTSIGCACYPRDGIDKESLLRHADSAMYGAKKFANALCFYQAVDRSERVTTA